MLLYSNQAYNGMHCTMSLDFDAIIDRSQSDSTKHRKYQDTGILPLWVADMDFRSPEPVIEAIVERARHGVFGYTKPSPELYAVIIERLKRLYDWQVETDDIVYIPGVVTGLNMACRGMAGAGESVMTVTPIYPPFMSSPEYSDRGLIQVPARLADDRWQVPLDELEAAAARPEAKLLLLCNPWNPVGRALTRDELTAIAKICRDNDVLICSDEIHCDLLFDGIRHIPTATLGRDIAEITVTLMAPSKTFNLAGFGGSFAVIQNPALRQRFEDAGHGIVPGVNIMAYTTMLAAYKYGEDWYQALIPYLQANRDYLYAALNQLPGIRMNHVEATYLAWLDVSALELDDAPAFFEAAGVGMSEGYRYGDDRYMRLNFGCSRKVLEEAVARISRALAAR